MAQPQPHLTSKVANVFTMPEADILRLVDVAHKHPALWRLAEYVVGTAKVDADRRAKAVEAVEQVAKAA